MEFDHNLHKQQVYTSTYIIIMLTDRVHHRWMDGRTHTHAHVHAHKYAHAHAHAHIFIFTHKHTQTLFTYILTWMACIINIIRTYRYTMYVRMACTDNPPGLPISMNMISKTPKGNE